MDIIVSRIGTGLDDSEWSVISTWDSEHIFRTDAFNVGVLYSGIPDLFNEEYQKFIKLEAIPAAFERAAFVLMTDTGVILASRIAGIFEVQHKEFPPRDRNDPTTSIPDLQEELIGHGTEDNFEEIARNYIHQKLDEYDPTISRSEVLRVIQECSQILVKMIADNPDALDEIEWRDLERLLKEALDGIGFSAILTPSSKDGGKDIVLECRSPSDGRKYFVEIKHWRSRQKVGVALIKEFYKIVVREKAEGGLFLSTYGITSDATEQLTEVERRRIRVGTKTKVVALCRSYVVSKSGVYLPSSELPTFLLDPE